MLIFSFGACSEFSKNPRILTFTGSHCTLRRSDGAIITTRYEQVFTCRVTHVFSHTQTLLSILPGSVSPFPAMLHGVRDRGQRSLEPSVRLCRFVKDPALWAVLAGTAAEARDLGTAETAYAAIDEVCTVCACTVLLVLCMLHVVYCMYVCRYIQHTLHNTH